MPKMNKKDIVKEIYAMIEKEKEFTEDENIKKDQNPQVVEMRHKAEGRIDALEDVLYFANRRKPY